MKSREKGSRMVYGCMMIIGGVAGGRFACFAGNSGELLQQSDSAAHRAEAEAGEARGVFEGWRSVGAAEAGEEDAARPEGDRVPAAQAV